MPMIAVNINTATTTTLIAAPAGITRVRVLGFFLAAAGAQTWKLQSATNDLFPAATMAAGQPHSYGPNYDGILDCNQAEALKLVTTTTAQLSGWIYYTIIAG